VPEELPDFKSILKSLNDAGVQFVVIGGLAMAAHGSTQVTRDIDLSYARSASNINGLAQVLISLHSHLRDVPAELPGAVDLRLLKNSSNLTLATDKGAIDILGEPPGIASFEQLWNNSIEMNIFGENVHVASVDDLVLMKQAAGRPKDQAHLAELHAIKAFRDRKSR
jgi:predicted nucleotidyltransferase